MGNAWTRMREALTRVAIEDQEGPTGYDAKYGGIRVHHRLAMLQEWAKEQQAPQYNLLGRLIPLSAAHMSPRDTSDCLIKLLQKFWSWEGPLPQKT